MILDDNCVFFDGAAVKGLNNSSSKVLLNGIGGDAADPLQLFVSVNGGSDDGVLTLSLQTSDEKGFGLFKELGAYTVTVKEDLKVKLPVGMRSYMRLMATSTFTEGSVIAALVVDADIKGVMGA